MSDLEALEAAVAFPPPEPRVGTTCSPDDFPGAGFVSGDRMDYEAMNAYAERVGWRCRFREHELTKQPLICYPNQEKDREDSEGST